MSLHYWAFVYVCDGTKCFRCALLCFCVLESSSVGKRCSRYCVCNWTWSFGLLCWDRVKCTAGGLNRLQAPSSWISIHTSELWSSQLVAPVFPSQQNETWIHFTSLGTNMQDMWYTVVSRWWILLWGCCSVSHNMWITFGLNSEIIMFFFHCCTNWCSLFCLCVL